MKNNDNFYRVKVENNKSLRYYHCFVIIFNNKKISPILFGSMLQDS